MPRTDGLACPVCGAGSRVLETRRRARWVDRRHVCRHDTGHTFHTVQVYRTERLHHAMTIRVRFSSHAST